MKNIFRVIIMIILCAFFNQCAKDPVDLTGSLSGTITDSETKEPIKGASVVLTPGGDSKTTGSDGKFEFDKLDANTYAVTASCNNYETDIKEASVVAGKAAQLDFSLNSILPELKVNVSTLNFGSDKSQLSIEISNSGQGILEWEIVSKSSWISSISPTSGEVATMVATVIITIDRTGLSTGDYTENIIVSSNVGSKEIAVSMTVSGSILEVTPLDIDFGATTTTKQLTLKNIASTGSISYTIEKSNSWLTLDRTSGVLDANSTSAIINMVVNRDGLSAGNYSGQVIVKSDVSSDITCAVNMNILQDEKPTVTIGSASSIIYNSAKVEATIVSLGSHSIDDYGFCWSTESNPTVDDFKSNLGDKSEIGVYEGIVDNLSPSTAYHIRAYATNKIGTSYSSEIGITTLGAPKLATVVTSDASDVDSNSAQLNGKLDDLGNTEVTEHGFIYGTTTTLSTSNGTKINLGKKADVGEFYSVISNLDVVTTYYYRSYAINEIGIAYGDVLSLVTKAESPVLTTKAATGLTHERAITGGTITSTGGNTIVERGVCWSKTNSSPTKLDNIVESSDSSDDFSVEITGLETTTTYYVSAYVSTSSNVYYAEPKMFETTTYRAAPTVETNEIVDISFDQATVNCWISDDGGCEITARGIYWSTSPNPTSADNVIYSGTGSGNYSITIENLSRNQTVYVKAFATNVVDTSYGEELSFTTRMDNIIYVSPTSGSDSNGGNSWSDAYATIAQAQRKALSGFEIWVQSGTISSEGITMQEGINIYGGFNGSEVNLSERQDENYTTIINNTIIQESAFDIETEVNGFRITNMSKVSIMILKGGVLNNVLIENNSVSVNAILTIQGGIIKNSSFNNNRYEASSTRKGLCDFSNGTIVESCKFCDNYTYSSTMLYMSSTHISNCLFSNNDSGGLFTYPSDYSNYSDGWYVMNNCTFVNNGKLSMGINSSSIITNSVFFNENGVMYNEPSGYIANCATRGEFEGTDNITIRDTDASILFNDDYTLQSGSPLINAGDNSFVGSYSSTDLKCDTRIQNGRVDIGAYEYNY